MTARRQNGYEINPAAGILAREATKAVRWLPSGRSRDQPFEHFRGFIERLVGR
jgi:hypothetical protein